MFFNPNFRCLVVRPEQSSLSVSDSVIELCYRFSDTEGQMLETAQGYYLVDVNNDTQELSKGFSTHVLNRWVAQLVIKHRIDAVFVIGLYGCTLDVPRMLSLMSVPSFFDASHDRQSGFTSINLPSDVHEDLQSFISASFFEVQCFSISDDVASKITSLGNLAQRVDSKNILQAIEAYQPPVHNSSHFDYSIYEFTQRDHALLMSMQRPYVDHFSGCKKVLDLGCGSGIFLQLLKDHNIKAFGVERSPAIAAYGRGMGLNIHTSDALEYLEQSDDTFDGIYCSHFVEHLPFDIVCKLIELMQEKLRPGGVLLLVFPDPESIRSQLLGFWRDPEHVRFYHPELICAVAETQRLECVWKSYEDSPHDVIAFSSEPEPLASSLMNHCPAMRPSGKSTLSLWGRILARLGIARSQDIVEIEASYNEHIIELMTILKQQQLQISQLDERTIKLWSVSKTWAWDDNAALRFVKHG